MSGTGQVKPRKNPQDFLRAHKFFLSFYKSLLPVISPVQSFYIRKLEKPEIYCTYVGKYALIGFILGSAHH